MEIEDKVVIISYLNKKYNYSLSSEYDNYIQMWEQWYDNEVNGFHDYHDQNGDRKELYKLGMAKRGCEDWASILFTEKDTIICDNELNQEYIDQKLKELKFDEVIPNNIEKAFWSGTVATLVRPSNVLIKNKELIGDEQSSIEIINMDANSIFPLRIENGKIVDIAFAFKSVINNKKFYTIERHILENGEYVIKNDYIDKNGEEHENKDIVKELHTHSTIPLFALLEPRIVNNINNSNGLGISVFGNAIDQLKATDIAFNNFVMDIVLGGKKVFYNKSLIKYKTITYTDGEGFQKTKEIPVYPDDITKQQFQVLDGELSGANDDTLLHEYNPDLRAEENEKIVNFALNLLAFKMGLGKGYYKFENGTVVTATQYLGENKDLVGNAKKHRSSLNEYTIAIARAILLIGRLIFKENVDENDNIELTNKDGFLVSEEELQNQYRQDFQAGLMSKKTYLMKARGMSEEQAIKELEQINEDNPSIEDLLGTKEE